jgi:NAD(P)-dependent dehydrogenase (short-subunit alcohol dehydrogenase family)
MKQAITGVAKNIAKNWGGRNIRCNCICPGAIASEALDEARKMAVEKYGDSLSPDAALDRFMIEEWHLDVALQRVGQPREVGELIAFLLSERAAYMTGALINIDGGTDF